MKVVLSLFLSVFAAAGCNDGPFRPEIFTKTRPLGVASTPISIQAGSEGALTLHVISPLNSSLTLVESQLYYASPRGQVESVTAESSAFSASDYSDLSHHAARTSFSAPDVTTLGIPDAGAATLNYRFVFADGDEQMTVNGKTMIYGPDNPALAYQDHVISIDEFSGPITVANKTDLTGTLAKGQDEVIKISWLVPNGKVTNRRDLTTTWEPEDSGVATLVLTARGQESQSLAIAFRDVSIQ